MAKKLFAHDLVVPPLTRRAAPRLTFGVRRLDPAGRDETWFVAGLARRVAPTKVAPGRRTPNGAAK